MVFVGAIDKYHFINILLSLATDGCSLIVHQSISINIYKINTYGAVIVAEKLVDF